MQSGVANYFEKKQIFAYKRISVYDASTTNLLDYAPQIVSFISKGLNYGSVLVHCQRGVSRSATAVLFYLMFAQGIGLDSALKSLKQRRQSINPIPAFTKQLQEYEKDCKGKGLICENAREGLKPNESMNTSAKKRKGIGPSIGPSREPTTSKQRVVGPSLPQKETNAIDGVKEEREAKDGTHGKCHGSDEGLKGGPFKQKERI